jgi:hypothetical protein
MKIGIVTFWKSADNYGQILQCYALQKFLKNLGHDAFLIKDIPLKPDKKKKLVHFLLHFSTKRVQSIVSHRWRKWRYNRVNKLYDRCFEKFKFQYINSTDREYSIEMLKKTPPYADVYICGSDQIWNSASPIYFLDFGDDDIKRIAYAPSFGITKNNDSSYFKQIAVWLKRFDVVTVREQRGIEICKKLGCDNASCAPDPTLLLSEFDYVQIAKPIDIPKGKYIFLYFLGNSTSINIKSIYEFAKRKKLEIIYVASQGHIDKYPKRYPTIEQWIFLIKNAEYIITNSFHGTVFSIIMNKKFLVTLLKSTYSEINDRIYTLLDNYKLDDRIFSTIDLIEGQIDYRYINIKLENDRRLMKHQMDSWLKN